MKTVKQYAEFKSKGEIEIRIFWNTLGGSVPVTEQVKNATLDMALTDDTVLGSFHKPMQAFQTPYLFASSAAAWEFTNTQAVRDMVEDMRNATGLRTLAFSENGFRNLTNNVRELKTPEDMKRSRMRTMQSQVYVAFMQSMGAAATPIAWPETIPALKTNVVDGQENAATTVLDAKICEVQKFGLAAIVGLWFEKLPFLNIASKLLAGLESFVLLAVPFYIVASELMNRGGISDRLIRLSTMLVGKIRGGTAYATIVASVFSQASPARRSPTSRRWGRSSSTRCPRRSTARPSPPPWSRPGRSSGRSFHPRSSWCSAPRSPMSRFCGCS